MKNIIIKNVSKSFGEKIVLHDFSAEISAKGITCIMGPSGCGKTTLQNILLGLIPSDKGIIENIPAVCAAVFQEDRLCNDFSAAANIRIICNRNVHSSDILSCLKSLGIEECYSRKVSELSGGMKRRVAIARALMADSDMIFMDEPFKGLDDDTKRSVINVLKGIKKPMTIITHDQTDVKLLDASLLHMEKNADGILPESHKF